MCDRSGRPFPKEVGPDLRSACFPNGGPPRRSNPHGPAAEGMPACAVVRAPGGLNARFTWGRSRYQITNTDTARKVRLKNAAQTWRVW